MTKPFARVPLVLVADDDDEMRALIADTLIAAGCHVIAARDGDSLLAAWDGAQLAGREPDIVVSDVRMPYKSGMEVAEWLSGRSTRVILISAFMDDETKVRARALGAHVMSKPFELTALRALVVSIVARVDLAEPA